MYTKVYLGVCLVLLSILLVSCTTEFPIVEPLSFPEVNVTMNQSNLSQPFVAEMGYLVSETFGGA